MSKDLLDAPLEDYRRIYLFPDGTPSEPEQLQRADLVVRVLARQRGGFLVKNRLGKANRWITQAEVDRICARVAALGLA